MAKRLLFVCLGNICRSPAAEGIFLNLIKSKGLSEEFLVDSAGTGGWHIGSPADDRMQKAASLGSGFLYVISRLGVTGIQEELAGGIEEMVARVRKVSKLPIALGFGISKPEHVSEVGRWADAAVVASSLVKIIAEVGDSEKLVDHVQEHVRWLKAL